MTNDKFAVLREKQEEIKKLKCELENKVSNPNYEYVVNNKAYFDNYIKMTEEVKSAKQRVKKQLQRDIENIENSSKQFKIQLDQYNTLIAINNEIKMMPASNF